MDPPATDNTEHKPEKIEHVKEDDLRFPCQLFDTEIIHKIAQMFLPGLASACVDNTTGNLFSSPASVAVDIRKEMVGYLTERSETFVAESIILEGDPDGEVSDHPYDIISDMVDDFASSKRNLFSRVSGWLLSETREDKIDDFVQEMEINGFWVIDRRETIAQALLKNVDFKNTFHCAMKFSTPQELAQHVGECSFRSVTCTNESCNANFSASQMEKHDSTCPFKMLPCEQKCSEIIMRREMDRHCITVCPMKLVNCPFYSIGCQSGVPHCQIEQHRSDDLQSHIILILRGIYKEASTENIKVRAEKIEEASSPGRLAEARSVRSLISRVKEIEAKLGKFEMQPSNSASEESLETRDSVPEVPVIAESSTH
uniref:TRAF-type domain-containing protein n=1 Tax=Kalanchoe fedtschenkoi TaxID=63787 RepID=A0A7N0TG32_KALFE